MAREIRVEGRLYRGNRIGGYAAATRRHDTARFSTLLEQCLVDICHELEMQVPLWMERNTKEFARYHQTMFTSEQFMDPVDFDRFQLKLMEDQSHY